MAKAIVVARTSAISQERESEFHDWYDNVHFKGDPRLPRLREREAFRHV